MRTPTTDDELLDAKLKLYQALLKLPEGNMTDNELELMFRLSKDEQVQAYLSSKE